MRSQWESALAVGKPAATRSRRCALDVHPVLHLALGFFGFVLQLFAAALDIASEAGHGIAAAKRDAQQNESNDAFQHRHLLTSQ